tara:strand:+ start:26197 stop:26853 length:657 start_codon:yes stop_codon:yes gene_type:complete
MKKELNYQTFFLVGSIIITLVIVFQLGKRNGEETTKSSIEFMNEKLNFYTSIDSLKLPTMVASLKKAKLDLNNVMGKVISISKLNDKNDSLVNLTKQQNMTIHSLNTNFNKILTEKDSLFMSLNALKESIPILNSKRQNYKLKEGEGVFLVKNLISIGIEDIRSSQVLFNINNTSDTLSVGNQLNTNIGGLNGILALTLINKTDSLNPYCRMEFLLIK